MSSIFVAGCGLRRSDIPLDVKAKAKTEHSSTRGIFAHPERLETQKFNISTPAKLALELVPTLPTFWECSNPEQASGVEVMKFLGIVPKLGMPLDRLFVVNIISGEGAYPVSGEIDRSSWSKLTTVAGIDGWAAAVKFDKIDPRYVTLSIDNMVLYDRERVAADSALPFKVVESRTPQSSILLFRVKEILQQLDRYSLPQYHQLFGEGRLLTNATFRIGIAAAFSAKDESSHSKEINLALKLLSPSSSLASRIKDSPQTALAAVLAIAATTHCVDLLTIRDEMRRFIESQLDLLAVAALYDFAGFKIMAKGTSALPKEVEACGRHFAQTLTSSGLYELGIESEHALVRRIESDSDPKLMAERALQIIEELIQMDFKPELLEWLK